MAHFIAPDSSVRRSFLGAMGEFEAEGVSRSITYDWIAEWSSRWDDAVGFAAFADALRADELPETPRKEGWVPCTTLWWVEGEDADVDYLGRLSIRHTLTDFLREIGGHIGYDVRPSARRQGHATAMLAAALPVARALGIEQARLTCDPDNDASRRVIEANGGLFDDESHGKLRFWVPTVGH